MIIVSLKKTFRDRSAEWIQAIGMFAWGIFTIASPGFFAQGYFYKNMLFLMSQNTWGYLISIIGLLRLIFLIINGAWRPSAHLRAIGCVTGILLWSNLFIASISLNIPIPVTPVYMMLIVLDFLSLWFSAEDAKLADLSAKSELEIK